MLGIALIVSFLLEYHLGYIFYFCSVSYETYVGPVPTKAMQTKKYFAFFFSKMFKQNFFFSIQIYMKDVECAESKEKSNFRFFRL